MSLESDFHQKLLASESLTRALMTANLAVESDPITPTVELLSDLLHSERPLSASGVDGHSWAHVRHLVADLGALVDREGDQSAFNSSDFRAFLGDLDNVAALAQSGCEEDKNG